MKNKEVLQALFAINGLSDLKLPPTGALKIRKLHRSLQQAWEDVQAVRQKLVDEYAERDGQGNVVPGDPMNGEPTVKLTEEGKDFFNAAWADLMEATVEIAGSLDIADLGSAEVQAGLLIGLGPLLNEE